MPVHRLAAYPEPTNGVRNNVTWMFVQLLQYEPANLFAPNTLLFR